MDICIIAPSLKIGGTERACANLANGLVHLDNRVSFVVLFDQDKVLRLDSRVRFFELKGLNKGSLKIFRTVRWIRSTIKEINPARIVVFNRLYSALLLLSLVDKPEIKVFISERTSPLFKWSYFVDIFSRMVFRLRPPAGVICQTWEAMTFQRNYHSSNVRFCVIPNSIKFVQLHESIRRERIVLAVGRLNDYLKGFDRLMRAWALVEIPDWRLVIAGGYLDDDDQLRELAVELDLLNRIEFVGPVADIDSLYAKSSIFVMPSRSEGFPNALCEAMAAGLACVSFDFITGPREIIADGVDGIIVKDGDIYGLSESIRKLILSEDLRYTLGLNALKIRERLSLRGITKEVLNFISE